MNQLATEIFNTECPDHIRKFMKEDVVINEIEIMIKRLVNKLKKNEKITDFELFNLFHFALYLRPWEWNGKCIAFENSCRKIHDKLQTIANN